MDNKLKFEIVFNEEGNYSFTNLPESLCMLICDVTDRGNRWAPDSRYTYNFGEYKLSKGGFSFGTAKACVQTYVLDNSVGDAKFDVYSVTANGSKLKHSTLKPLANPLN